MALVEGSFVPGGTLERELVDAELLLGHLSLRVPLHHLFCDPLRRPSRGCPGSVYGLPDLLAEVGTTGFGEVLGNRAPVAEMEYQF